MYAKLLLILCLLFSLPALGEEIVQLAPVAPGIMLHTTVLKPDGPGPFPVVIVNHGKDLGLPSLQPSVRYLRFSSEFLKRGYAVILPMRRGFARSSGEFSDHGCDLPLLGKKQADDIELAINYYSQMPWFDKTRIIVAGQSFGGLATVAFGARNYPGVVGTINLVGGLKYHNSFCQWEKGLVMAMAEYGAASRIPSLWFYAKNDSHFDVPLAKEMHAAYTKNGGNATLVTEYKQTYTKDPHGMIVWSDGYKFWWPETEKFLMSLGLPVADLQLNPVLAD